MIASRASFSLREFSTKRFPTTERRINVMSESTCKKYKNIYIHKYKIQIQVVSKRTHPKKTCPGEFMRGLKTELCVLNILLFETLETETLCLS